MTERIVHLELELLSPCFMGDAHQHPEFRIASIRGLWRYWYRALHGRGGRRRRDPDRGNRQENRSVGSG